MSDIAAIASTSSSQTAGQTKQQKISADLKALAAALAKNDTKAAQTAMKQLQIDSAGGSASNSSSSSNPGGSPEIAEVSAALKTGNLPAAQSAFAKFESHAAAAFQQGLLSSSDQAGGFEVSSKTQKSNGLASSSAGTVAAGGSFSVVI